MKLSIVAAMDKNWTIGKDGKLPWRIPLDLKHFRNITIGNPVVMGRKTAESLGKPLSKRVNIVLTGGGDNLQKEFYKVDSIREAIKLAKGAGADELFFIGGAFLFRQALSIVDRLYLTFIDGEFPGDTYFPMLNWDQWNFTDIERHYKGHEGLQNDLYFVVLERILPLDYANSKPPAED